MQNPNQFKNNNFVPSSNPNLFTNAAAMNLLSNPSNFPYPVNMSLSHNMFNMPSMPSMPSMPNMSNMSMPSSMSNQGASDSSQANLFNMLAMWKLQNEMQSQMMKNQLAQMIEAKEGKMNQMMPKNNINFETKPPPQMMIKKPEFASNQFLPELCDSNKSIKAHLKDIMYFVLDNFGIRSEQEFKIEKLKYRNNQDLMMVFDALVAKYAAAVKSKDEMIKYTFRKALKFMKQKMKNEMKKGNAPGAGSAQKRQFKSFLEEMSGNADDDDDEDNVEKTMLPFKQNAKNNHISPEVLAEAFSYSDFSEGFREYLKNLDATLELDNNKKIDKFIRYIEGVLKRNTVKDIKKYKRIPWLKLWIQNTKHVAFELVYAGQGENQPDGKKIVKKEEYQESQDNFSAKIEDGTC